MTAEAAFPSRLLPLAQAEAAAAGPTFDPARINMHIVGLPDGQRIMAEAEAAQLLNDPFGALLLRKGVFPANLTELLDGLDAHAAADGGLPQMQSFLISEGGQIPFQPGVRKGNSRLITVRSRDGKPHLMISCLLSPGTDPRGNDLLLEVIGWDPINRTFHFYQRQEQAWFWCGQSDMALNPPTRGEGPFDSHINGYPNMKELKFPWVHWHGPSLAIAETAFAPDDPLVSDPLFVQKATANIFQEEIIETLAKRWNEARFDKAIAGGTLASRAQFLRQVTGATSFNLISSVTRATQLGTTDVSLPPTFFFDQDCLVDDAGAGLRVTIPRLTIRHDRYAALVARHRLTVQGDDISRPGDVPFCFTVPERAFEDVIVVRELIERGLLSRRLAACVLMVDFANPLLSDARNALLAHLPSGDLGDGTNLDQAWVETIANSPAAATPGSPEARFMENWNLGPDAWVAELGSRLSGYLAALATRLATDEGSDDVFRLAERRRRIVNAMPLAEFDLSLPVALALADEELPTSMQPDATVA